MMMVRFGYAGDHFLNDLKNVLGFTVDSGQKRQSERTFRFDAAAAN